jgi:hypothetical protein
MDGVFTKDLSCNKWGRSTVVPLMGRTMPDDAVTKVFTQSNPNLHNEKWHEARHAIAKPTRGTGSQKK